MSLNHEFALIAYKTCAPSDFDSWTKRQHRLLSKAATGTSIPLHDDLVQYISDTLAWVPTYNPSKCEDQNGLDLYGVTAILPKGAAIAAEIFENWAALFRLAPNTICLTGQYAWYADRRAAGRYQRLAFSKRETVKAFRGIAKMCRRTAEDADTFWMLHEGI